MLQVTLGTHVRLVLITVHLTPAIMVAHVYKATELTSPVIVLEVG